MYIYVYLGSALGTSFAEGQQFDEYGAMWISDGLGGVPRVQSVDIGSLPRRDAHPTCCKQSRSLPDNQDTIQKICQQPITTCNNGYGDL